MSSASTPLTHRELADLLLERADAAVRERLERLRREDPRYRLLFDILDALPPAPVRADAPDDRPLFDSAGEFLEAHFGGSADPAMGAAFRSRLATSPAFYRAVLRILDDVEPETAPAPDAALAARFPRRRSAGDFLQHTIMPAYSERPGSAPAHKGPSLLERLVDVLRSPAPAYALAAVLALLLLFRPAGDRNAFDALSSRWTAALPAPYDPAAGQVRGTVSDGAAPGAAAFERVESVFNLGIASYMALDYRDAATQFAGGADDAGRLWQALTARQAADSLDTAGRAAAATLIDYHFFSGMVHLGLAASEGPNLRHYHLNRAIAALNRSLEAAGQFQSGDADRSRLYLGIAYALEGDTRSARDFLRDVPADSPHHAEAQKRLTDLDAGR